MALHLFSSSPQSQVEETHSKCIPTMQIDATATVTQKHQRVLTRKAIKPEVNLSTTTGKHAREKGQHGRRCGLPFGSRQTIT